MLSVEKRGTVCVTRAELASIPNPEPCGPRHRPIPHHELISKLDTALRDHDLEIVREEYAVARRGALLFGTLDLRSQLRLRDHERDGQGFSLALRSGNGGQHALKIVAGLRTFVCDNMCLAGDFVALKKRHTTRLDLPAELSRAVEAYLGHEEQLVAATDRAKAATLEDDRAKLLIYEVFAQRILPTKLLPHVASNYFQPRDKPDCSPRSLWGLHGAFTRECRSLSPPRRTDATTRLARLLSA